MLKIGNVLRGKMDKVHKWEKDIFNKKGLEGSMN